MKPYAPLLMVLLLVSASFVGVAYNFEKSSTLSSNGITLYVGGSGEGNYTKIQDAIDNASDGDTVFVYNGTYVESLIVNKSINLIGENRDTTEIFSDWEEFFVINIDAENVKINGFTIILNYGLNYFNLSCITINSCNNNISNNIIKGYWWEYETGIDLKGSSNNNVILGNIILENYFGIYISTSSDNIIKNNNFSNNFVSIVALSSSNNIIKSNSFNKNQHDISIENYCINNIITENAFSNTKCCFCISISYSNKNTVSYNIINSLPLGIGIFLRYSNYNTISDNTIKNLKWQSGVKLFSSSNNNISSNNLISCDGVSLYYYPSENYCISFRNFRWNNLNSDNSKEKNYGINYFDYGDNNTMYHNNFINNSQNAYDECNNTWDDEYPSGGNYWDDYNGVDTDGDGIGDTPYNIDGGNNQDKYPLMRPYNYELPTPDTVYVDDDFDSSVFGWEYDHFGNIQDGIDAVNEKGTVYVYNGTYIENVVVSKSIDLIGENKETTIIDGNWGESVVDILADYVKINGFTIQNSSGMPPFTNGGIRLHSIGSNISQNIFSNNAIGIFVYQSDNIYIYKNIISNGLRGISIESDSGYIFIEENSIISNQVGIITYQNAHSIYIAYNYISDNDKGIIFHSGLTTIFYNTIINNSYGIISYSNAFNSVRTNNIINNTVNARYGYRIIDVLRPFFKTKWNYNYWGSPKQRPVPIFGRIGIIFCLIPWFPQFDWNPAQEPYDIEV